jgi:hypothetical protein
MRRTAHRRRKIRLVDSHLSLVIKCAVFCGLMACGSWAAAQEDEEEVPAMEFLEYLGSWEGSDEDWEVVAEVVKVEQSVAQEAPTEAAAKEEESVETDDES